MKKTKTEKKRRKMRSDRRILLAFAVNLVFSLVELIGGLLTASVAIISDSLHDLCDAATLLISYICEKISKKPPSKKYSFGYLRFSTLGSFLQYSFLLFASIAIIAGAVRRLFSPTPLNHTGIIILAIIGIIANTVAMRFTSDGHNENLRAVSLHMLEDVLGWVAVLIGAILMKAFPSLYFLDPLLSIAISLFMIINCLSGIKRVADIFLEKTPVDIDVDEVERSLLALDGVEGVKYLHIWNYDENYKRASLHVLAPSAPDNARESIKKELLKLGVIHATIECEISVEKYNSKKDSLIETIEILSEHHEHHHRHHHHH